MSKPWNPRLIPGRARKAGWAGQWDRHRRPMRRTRWRKLDRGEVVGMVLAGLLLGLSLSGVPGWPGGQSGQAPAAPAEVAAADPWAESRRSRAILEAQEGAPEPAALAPFAAGPAAAGRIATGRIATAGAVRIVDGDTFHYGGAKIRIADIDTPEVRGRCAHETRLAARATERMAALLRAGPFELSPIPGRDEDRYGRKLRIVTRGGRSLGDQMVAEGLARTWTGRREPWCG